MTAREQGFLLLTSSLGDLSRKHLTLKQFRTLILRAKEQPNLREASAVTMEDMLAMGYDDAMAQRVVDLFSERERMMAYLRLAKGQGCSLIALSNPQYPAILAERLGLDAPTVLWAKGNLDLLAQPAIALVGSRELKPENWHFAQEVGRWAAQNGFVLVSGNARGADRVGQESCLQHGGQIISVVANKLTDQPTRKNVLYLSENSFDLDFSSYRALSRNRIIHAMGAKTFVAQSDFKKGGTWDGTVKNLRHGWSPVYCFADESPACRELTALGAQPIINL